MTSNVPFLRTSRHFPDEIKQLAIESSKSYIDTANAVNVRTIGIFTTNVPTNTGESWFLTGNQRQQSLRQVYRFTDFLGFNHGLNFANLTMFSRIYGVLYTGVNYLPLPYVEAQTPSAAIGIYVTSTQVKFTLGTTPPAIVSGIIVLEWLSNV